MKLLTRKKFYFARHGTTDWNDKKLCQGQTDIELNDLGRKEALALGRYSVNLSLSNIYASPLKRAKETALIVHQFLPSIPIYFLDELKERFWGELEGGPSLEMYQIEEMEELHPNYHPNKGIEPREQLKARILKGMNLALEQDGEVLIISHGRLFIILCELLQVPMIRQIPNATLIECAPIKEGWHMNVKSIQ